MSFKYRMNHYFILFLILFSFLISPVSASALEASEIVRLLQERYEKAQNVTAIFQQETIPAGSSQGIKAEGLVFFKRPQQMRWEYEKPEKQLIVTSGEEVFVYEEEVKQVIIVPRDQFLTSEISKAFFLGKGDLENFFSVHHIPDAPMTIKLVPRETSPQLKELLLTMDERSHLVREMWLQDHLGGKTHLLFKNIKINNNLQPALFTFTPPKGAEIYRTR